MTNEEWRLVHEVILSTIRDVFAKTAAYAGAGEVTAEMVIEIVEMELAEMRQTRRPV
jgi:hypothetical protein